MRFVVARFQGYKHLSAVYPIPENEKANAWLNSTADQIRLLSIALGATCDIEVVEAKDLTSHIAVGYNG